MTLETSRTSRYDTIRMVVQEPLKGALTLPFVRPFRSHRLAYLTFFVSRQERWKRWHFIVRSHRSWREKKAHGGDDQTHGACSKGRTVPRVCMGDEKRTGGERTVALTLTFTIAQVITVLIVSNVNRTGRFDPSRHKRYNTNGSVRRPIERSTILLDR